MELPQARPFGTQDGTHDFLSLYSHPTVQQDPRPPRQGNHLKTHDFLQPLEERAERKSCAKDEGSAEEMSSVVQKTPPPPPSVEHNILPGGIGTYSISHISSFKRNQRVLKPDASGGGGGSVFTVAQASSTDRNDENSNCSSYSGSDFSLWEESAAVKKVKTGKENHVGDKPFMAGSAAKLGQGKWTLSEQTSSFSNNHRNSFNSVCSSQTSGQKNQNLLEMLKSARDRNSQDEELGNSEAFILKKEPSNTPRGVQVDEKSRDQKPNTPRSKHSATEQRRRSKINDRFQMLRALIPNSEQKRDKASFLLEVIEYVHFLQEKVHKYERSYQGWNHEPEKSMPWRNDQRPAECFVDQSRGTCSGSGPSPTLLFASKIDDRNINISPTIPGNIHNVESGMSTTAMTIPLSSQQNFLAAAQSGGPGGGVVSQLTNRLATDAENSMYQSSVQCQAFSCATEMAAIDDKPKEKDLSVEGGAISISSVYSKGLLHTLTEALQSSGVDLSQASISVQIELCRQANNIRSSPTLMTKDDVFPSRNKGIGRPRVARAEDSEQAGKKLKTCRS